MDGRALPFPCREKRTPDESEQKRTEQEERGENMKLGEVLDNERSRTAADDVKQIRRIASCRLEPTTR
jgi:hypothetical protein